jgi:hypothetical protein
MSACGLSTRTEQTTHSGSIALGFVEQGALLPGLAVQVVSRYKFTCALSSLCPITDGAARSTLRPPSSALQPVALCAQVKMCGHFEGFGIHHGDMVLVGHAEIEMSLAVAGALLDGGIGARVGDCGVNDRA